MPSSKLLYLSAIISAVTCVAHSNIGLEIAPVLQTTAFPAGHFGQNAWWQVSGYFLLNGIIQLGMANRSCPTGAMGEIRNYYGLR
jgi:hypothetical protein